MKPFESSVILYSSKTLYITYFIRLMFESSVILYSSKTRKNDRLTPV